MTSLVFFGKEIREIFRTYKIYALPVVFMVFGFASPILTKMMPDILGELAGDMGFQLPEMTWRDSYAQFFKNLNQIGMLALIITTMGTVADEKARGVAQLVLTKPLSRTGYLLSKFAANGLLLAASSLLAFAATWYYTIILFDGTELLPGLAGIGLYLAYALLILALTLLCSVLTRSLVAAGGLSVLGFFLLSILPAIHRTLAAYSPAALLNYQEAILTGGQNLMPELGWAIVLCIALTVLTVTAAAAIFSRQEL